jgi:archaellum biogenesis ATPase FlaH
VSETLQDVKKFIEGTGLKYRETDTHFQLNCFLCNDNRERLGVSKETGAWNCFHCDSNGTKLSTFKYAYEHRGNITTKDNIEKDEQEEKCKIKPDFHKPFMKRIRNTKKFQSAKYLIKERGLSKETLRHFQLGARRTFKNKDGENYDAGEYVAIPYIKDGKCVNVKYRALDPDVEKGFKWRREKGGISALFNDSVIDNLDYDEIFIAESEIDCMSLWSMGIKNVIGLTVGAKGFKQPWYDRLLRFNKIYLVLDNDSDGQKGAKKLAKRLGMGRCYNILLPDDVKDPNDYLNNRSYDLNHFYSLADKAKRFDVEQARSLTQIMRELHHKRYENPELNEETSYDTPWPKVNRILGSLKPGYLFVLAGKPKSGKTSLAQNLMKYWGEKHQIHTGIYSCEMRGERLADKWVMMESPVAEKIEDVTELQFKTAWNKLPHEYLHTYEPKNAHDLDVDGTVENCEAMIQRYGLELIIIDNLHYLCRGDNENELVSQATQKFKLMAERNDIVVVLITHPRKTNNNKQLKTDDLKGSSSIFQDADLLWLMHRPAITGDLDPEDADEGKSEGSLSPRTEILITGRWTDGGKTFLAFNGGRSLFLDRGDLYNQVAKELGKSGSKPKRGAK